MSNVRSIIGSQEPGFISVLQSETTFEAIGLLKEKDVGALLVLDHEGNLVGLLSERDLIRKMFYIRDLRPPLKIKISDLMTPFADLHVVGYETSVETCLAMMIVHGIRHLPVLENNTVVGILSIKDVVKKALDDQMAVSNMYLSYIEGGHT